jgi:hypothetical protein
MTSGRPLTIALGIAILAMLALTVLPAQQRDVARFTEQDPASSARAGAEGLSPLDYIEIQQLVSSYPYGLDGNTDNGESYANLFTPGGVFGRPRTDGHANLAALANTQPHGAKYVRHFITNHVIEPAPGGAIGKEYAVVIDIGENGNPSGIALGGRYDDEYVKTPEGWKFKSRTFTPSRVEVQPPLPGGGRGGRGQQPADPGAAPSQSGAGR